MRRERPNALNDGRVGSASSGLESGPGQENKICVGKIRPSFPGCAETFVLFGCALLL